MANTLDYLHSQRIVHRDIKPGNILLNERSRALLFDSGAAIDLNSDAPIAGRSTARRPPGARTGTRGDATIDGRADIYALGGTLYRMVAGRKPFYGTRRVAGGPSERTPPRPSQFAYVSPALEAAIPRAGQGTGGSLPNRRRVCSRPDATRNATEPDHRPTRNFRSVSCTGCATPLLQANSATVLHRRQSAVCIIARARRLPHVRSARNICALFTRPAIRTEFGHFAQYVAQTRQHSQISAIPHRCAAIYRATSRSNQRDIILSGTPPQAQCRAPAVSAYANVVLNQEE